MQHSITLPDEVKGWLLRKLYLKLTQEALVLTAGNLRYAELIATIYKVMPEGKYTSNIKAKDVFIYNDL
jgi:hypothetical protein